MIKTIALKAVVKDGMIKPLGATDPQEDKEVVIHLPEKKKWKNILIGRMKNGKDLAFIVL